MRTTILLLLTLLLSTPLKAADRPNVIFILADDLGYRELGSFGQKLIRTPHLDRLAESGDEADSALLR